MLNCPHCDALVPPGIVECPSCDEDVATIALLQELPDHLFNQALNAVKRGDPSTALARCGMGLSLRFNDAGLWMLYGLIAARQGALGLAESSFQSVLMFNGGYEPAEKGLELIRRIREHEQKQRE